jgi:hypothetical protein
MRNKKSSNKWFQRDKNTKTMDDLKSHTESTNQASEVSNNWKLMKI